MRNSSGSGSERVWSGISTNTLCPVNRPPRPCANTALIAIVRQRAGLRDCLQQVIIMFGLILFTG